MHSLVRRAGRLYNVYVAKDNLQKLLSRDPFEPFRVRLTSGDHYDIRSPFSAALMKSRLFIALPNSDKSVYVPFLHIAALETLGNDRRKSSGRRRRP